MVTDEVRRQLGRCERRLEARHAHGPEQSETSSPIPLSAAAGRNQIGGSLRPPGLQSFNTEVTAMHRALRVEGLMVTEYTEPLPGDDMLIRT